MARWAQAELAFNFAFVYQQHGASDQGWATGGLPSLRRTDCRFPLRNAEAIASGTWASASTTWRG